MMFWACSTNTEKTRLTVLASVSSMESFFFKASPRAKRIPSEM